MAAGHRDRCLSSRRVRKTSSCTIGDHDVRNSSQAGGNSPLPRRQQAAALPGMQRWSMARTKESGARLCRGHLRDRMKENFALLLVFLTLSVPALASEASKPALSWSELGCRSPIGFQGYGIKGDSEVILRRTMEGWRRLNTP